MMKISIACQIASNTSNIKKALKIALIVGTILNLINQGDAIIGMHLENIHIGKLILTYTVPFFVSLYTAVTLAMKRETKPKNRSFRDASVL